ncbi:metal ABC transporter substrate-binding protein [Chroococcidiopsis sp. CCMEE 29]|uniref:metal ABC transporter substrate-binding protein n=1 Tax=Chroococcidiopsis sp. CCMEE 29 TaxID=155894 RepID=UPI00201FBE79|nr:metal ABC transporter substrate-binding protein [Chroococcidiopsis sp. CCMEE 29]
MKIRKETESHPPLGYRTRRRGLSVLALLLLSAITGCEQPTATQPQAQEATPQAQQLEVVATFLPMYWLTRAVTGDTANVDVLIPPGSEVHEYQATPADVQAIAQANVLVKNGLGMEEFLAGTVKSAQNPQLREINTSQGIEPLKDTAPVAAKTDDHDHDHAGETDHGHTHEEGNPHVWLDPVLAQQQVTNIRDGLIAADPANKATYEANAATYVQQLQTLDKEFQQRLQKYPNCTFVTFHDAYPYLANRYGLKQVAVVQIPEDQLSPADVSNTINAVKKYNVKAVFGEPEVDNRLLKSLAQDLNLTYRVIDPLESGPLDPQHYFQVMRTNLQSIEAGCR